MSQPIEEEPYDPFASIRQLAEDSEEERSGNEEEAAAD